MSNPQQTHPAASLEDMIKTITKTFVIAHEQDSDEHLAQALVYNAGRLAWRMRENGVDTDYKTSVSDVVTDADRAAEAFVAGVLEALRPEDGLLGEEGANRASISGKTWVIDPVDGTYNFTKGSDYWCSAIALVEGNPAAPSRLHFGAVHRPAMGYTWFGGPGIRTTRDGQDLKMLVDAPLDQVSLATYIHPTRLEEDAIRAAWLRVATKPATLRMFGAGSIDLATIADGSVGAWVQHSVADWDWLPGRALIEGVGGACIKVAAGGVEWCVAGNAQTVSEISETLSALD
ncbi:fructose 1,6-bisphosphatase [Corynebacterium crudilactis]|uniref:Fructose 1,6-bisphosphatase n=2 Tax=Corynebacterium crudilactis TaxID=1652495 RepID=A0A172QRZ2_9CORY|nr:inositol monophosphatase family protein [Corynebacterium crudilactis]ANE03441.1 fructose 1,6-bisphosphatase [Corynebacterium crudilactis]